MLLYAYMQLLSFRCKEEVITLSDVNDSDSGDSVLVISSDEESRSP